MEEPSILPKFASQLIIRTMRKSGLFLLAGLFFIHLFSFGQMVYTDPAIPYADEAVTVYFNAAGTPLEGYDGDIYAHTGVTVNGNQWTYVLADWDENIEKAKLGNIGSDLYQFDIDPTIREFYEAEETDEITELCFVFRSSDGGTQTDPDIFIEVYPVGLNVQITVPDISPYFVDPGESINIIAEASQADEISLYVDDELITTVSGNSLNETIIAGNVIDSKKWIKVVAADAVDEVADSIYYYIRGTTEVADLPEGVVDGINYIDNQTVTLVLHAPLKSSIFAGGDFSDWEVDPAYKLKRTFNDPANPATRYWVTITGLNPGQEYAFVYLVDETIVVSDPYSEKILDPWNDKYIPEENYPNLKPYPEQAAGLGLLTVIQTDQEEYNWQIEDFEAPDQTNLIIYELLIRDFTAAENYQTLTDTINYLKTLGVNAIELMPVNEFDGNNSWGYNPNHYFALDKQYGTKNAFKEFIDVCHGHGIAVILDVVFNHATGISPYCKLYWDDENGRPAANSPFYNPVAKHDYNVFHDMNHENPATKHYISNAIKYWLEEYKVDGYRLDLSKGLTQTNTLGNTAAWGQYDQSRINILNDYADAAWSVNPDAYFILEHFADNSEEKVLSNNGMMPWGNLNYNYNEATMGYNENNKSNFSGISYQNRGWDDPHLIGYMESHDEERLMYKNVSYGNSASGYNIKELTTALERQQLAAAFFFTIPGPKMIWQFGELGYDYSKYYDIQSGQVIEGDDGVKVSPKPIRWDYTEDFRREALYNVYSSLIQLKKEEPVFSTSDFSLNVNYAMKSIHLNHSSMNVAILGNFGVVTDNIEPEFQHTGYWYDYFSGDSINVADVNAEIELSAGEYKIYTDVKLEKPEIGLGISDHSNQSSIIRTIYPNPSDDQFNIAFDLTEKTEVEVNIYNLSGQRVKSVYNGKLSQGKHTIVWNGLNEGGERVHEGMYFAELMIDGQREVKKLIVK